VTVAQKEGAIDEDGDAVVEEEADAKDDVVKPPWTACRGSCRIVLSYGSFDVSLFLSSVRRLVL
jgi:hypothetical protein